jgi:hypothetical protein
LARSFRKLVQIPSSSATDHLQDTRADAEAGEHGLTAKKVCHHHTGPCIDCCTKEVAGSPSPVLIESDMMIHKVASLGASMSLHSPTPYRAVCVHV